jgi:hypothetical protein
LRNWSITLPITAAAAGLPREVEVPEGEDVPEWLGRIYGFTVAGFDMETPEGKRSFVRI